MRRSLCFSAALAGCAAMWAPQSAHAQLTWRDFVVTSGISAEGYQGNLPTAASVLRDSTEFVSALVGEAGARGSLTWRPPFEGLFSLAFDGGMRQFAARGFELRDYAPREWVGTADGTYLRGLGQRTTFSLVTRLRGREVEDRPPMPLFLQPGYLRALGGIGLERVTEEGVRVDLEVSGERADFFATRATPQVRLLDRTTWAAQVGASFPVGSATSLRVYGIGESTLYPEQSTFLTDDPHRRDRSAQGGFSLTHASEILAEFSVEGKVNRSNSPRPEYDALTARGMVTASLPAGLTGSAFAAVSLKRYVHPTDFARLIPGEEANNTSLAYLSLSRLLARNLDGTVRIGWTRAETEIGGAYFQRAGVSLLLSYRPDF